MAKVGQMRFTALTLLEQPRVRVSARGVRIVAAPLAAKVSAASRVPTVTFAIAGFANKRGLRRPGTNQGAVDREVFLRQQLLPSRNIEHLVEQQCGRACFEQAITVLAETGVIPPPLMHRQAHEPTIEYVVAQLLDDLPLAADPEQDLPLAQSIHDSSDCRAPRHG